LIDPKIDVGNMVYVCELQPLSATDSLTADKFSWLSSFFLSAIIYIGLSKIFPPVDTFVDHTIDTLDDPVYSTDAHEMRKYPSDDDQF
jgi:hypothetical protein